MPQHYAGTTGVTLTLVWFADAAANDVKWQAAFRAVPDDAEDVDTTAHSYTYNHSGGVTVPSAIGEAGYDDITFTDGADMDSVAAGISFILRIKRDPADPLDNMTSDASLWQIHVKET